MPNNQIKYRQITEFSLNTLLSKAGENFQKSQVFASFRGVFFLIKQLLSNKNGIKYDMM